MIPCFFLAIAKTSDLILLAPNRLSHDSSLSLAERRGTACLTAQETPAVSPKRYRTVAPARACPAAADRERDQVRHKAGVRAIIKDNLLAIALAYGHAQTGASLAGGKI
jgi:hypothetical protein